MEKTFYHSSDRPLEAFQADPFLRPSAQRQPINGREDAYIFASDDELHSLTYTVTKGVRLMNGHVDETGAQFLVLDREAVIGDPALQGGIFTIKSDAFEQAVIKGVPSNQWVTTTPVDLRPATHRPVTSLNDLMAKGIQLYQLSDHYTVDEWTADSRACADDQSLYALIAERVEQGRMRWMNEERGIKPVNPFPTAQNEETSLKPRTPSAVPGPSA